MKSIFDIERINERLAELKISPKQLSIDKYEPTYTVTQLFENGDEVTLYFVIRNGEIIFYDSKKTRKPEK